MRSLLSNRKRQQGTSSVELAIAGPVLLLMVLGAADFARVFYHAVTLTNAAGTGAFYGAQTNIKTGHYDGIKQVAQNEAKDVGAITINPDRYCDCPDGTRVDCVAGFCAGYGAPRVYVKTQTLESFRPLVPYPGIPNPVTVGQTAYIRAQ